MKTAEPCIPDSIIAVSKHYQRITGIDCNILPMSVSAAEVPFSCVLCFNDKEGACEEREQCMNFHRHNALQSERFGGSFTYFCAGSLLFWASPIIIDNKMSYALIAGPVMILEIQEVSEELKNQGKVLSDCSVTFLENMKKIEISAVYSFSEILRMCAGWASGYKEHRMEETFEYLQNQSKISEYIQELNHRFQNGYVGFFRDTLVKEEQLQELIRLGDRVTAQQKMNELLGEIFFTGGNTPEKIRFRCMELAILLSRAAIQGGAPEQEVMEISYRFQRELGKRKDIEEIEQWLAEILHQYTDLVFEKKHIAHGQIMMRAIHFIRSHYTQKISLEDISSYIGMNPTYFSKLFNKEMESSLSDYINGIRIENAKRLLVETNYTLVEIAGCVGFEDQGYFSKKFKQFVGISPGSYRKRIDTFPDDTEEIHAN